MNRAAAPSHESPAAMAVQPPEQLRYAQWLGWGTRLGLLVLVLSFAAYALGGLPPRVPVHELPALWQLPSAEFVRLTGTPVGWAWLGQLQHGDLMGLAGIALLAGCSMPCLLALVPLYARAGDRAYVVICVAEVVVLLLAASGVFAGGH